MLSKSLLGSLLTLLVISGSSQATPFFRTYDDILEEEHNAVSFCVGAGSPVGFLGVTYSRVLTDHLQLESGAGWGSSGVQIAVMPKLLAGNLHHHFTASVGPSLSIPFASAFADGLPVWLNVEPLGYEHRFDHGMSFSIAVGFSIGLGGGHVCSLSLDCDPKPSVSGEWFPSARLGIGTWF